MIKRFFSKHADTIRRWLTHRHVPIILACVGIVLTLPVLGTGLIADDYMHRAMLVGQWPWPAEDASLFGMFSFLDGSPEQIRTFREVGLVPWWMFEDFQMRVAFWRPLTEITHWLDYQLWPKAPWLMHLHSLFWFGAVIWVLAHLYRKTMGSGWVAGLAGAFFAVNGLHGAIAGLICHRNTLIAAFFGGLALLAHIRWRQDGWRPGIVLGPLCYLLGLLAKEAALAIGAYLFAYTLFLDQGRIRRKITGFLPYVVITAGWYLVYRHLGFGARGVPAVYIDPGHDPLLFINALIRRLPLLLLGQFTGIPSDLGAAGELLLPGSVMMGCVAAVGAVLALIGLILYPLFRCDAVVRFWAVGILLGLVPACIAFPSNRLLFFSGIGAMGIIARFVASWVEQPAWLPVHRLWKRSARILCLIFVVVYLILSPLALQLLYVGLGSSTRSLHQLVSTMPYEKHISQKTVVLMNPSRIFTGGAMISLVRAAYGYSVPARTWSLARNLPLTITRIDERTIDIECEQGLLPAILNRILRGPSHPMHAGQRITLSDMSVEVLALADDWQPSRARFTFAVPLDDPSLLLLCWKDGKGFVLYNPPAVGESEILSSTVSTL